ncbi:MAG TPA: site-specific integrase [Egibacteraceae bacterium]|nr:site-specific integrase [Egibacteraceae bacterium]
MAHIQDRGKDHAARRWQARYRDPAGRERSKTFPRKLDAQRWLDEKTAEVVTGKWVPPEARKVTVGQWCDQWLDGYGRRASTVRQAKVHLAKIRAEFGPLPLHAVRPSMVRSWLSRLADEGYAASYLHALHARLSQLMTDAALDGLIMQNPCSRRTSPGMGAQRPHVATTDQIFAVCDAVGERHRVGILLGAFAGLRVAEACGLRVADVAFLEREIRPAVEYPAEPLKTDMSRTAVPIADALVEAIAGQVERWPAVTVLSDGGGGQVGPWVLQREVRAARAKVDGLPEGFRFQDLRHYFASLLIASGADVKVVQHRLRHSSAKTTLDTYSHLWPDSDESTRAAVERVMSRRLTESVRNAEGV